MNMMSGGSDLQDLRSANEDSLTLVIPKNQRVTNKETGNINLNLLVITDQANNIGEGRKLSGRNDDGESWSHDRQRPKIGVSLGDYKVLRAEKITWEREKAALTERVNKMERNGVTGNPMRGRNNLKKSNWEHMDFMNADNINKYCQLTIYPLFKILPVGWDRYSENNCKTLCYKVNNIIRVPDGMKKEWYWFDKVVPIMSKTIIDMRSNTRGACRKQYMSEINVPCVICDQR